MALYVYQGFWEDCLILGGSVVWPGTVGSNPGTFRVFLIQDHVDLDGPDGLDKKELKTWTALDAQTAITECSHTDYTRFPLQPGNRYARWDGASSPQEIELYYDNVAEPITWVKLGDGETGQDIGAYLICRDDGANHKLWMADSGATGLPARTNGEDLTLTLNTEAFLKGYQPNQP